MLPNVSHKKGTVVLEDNLLLYYWHKVKHIYPTKLKGTAEETMYNYNYNGNIYFSLYANCSLITYQPNRANLIKKKQSLMDTTKALLKGSQNDLKNCETRGQKIWQLHLQFDVAGIYQSRPLELPDYCE